MKTIFFKNEMVVAGVEEVAIDIQVWNQMMSC